MGNAHVHRKAALDIFTQFADKKHVNIQYFPMFRTVYTSMHSGSIGKYPYKVSNTMSSSLLS